MSAAARKRRWRKRIREGLVVIPIEVDEHAATEMLIERELLREEDLDDKRAVAVALGRLVKDMTTEVSFDATTRTSPKGR
jgi:hypothetical protein